MNLFNKLFNTPKKTLTVKHGFAVTGTKHYQANFKMVLRRNKQYDLPKSKIKYDVYEYDLIETTNSVRLVEEPMNEYDPNAIRVEFMGSTLGYIKKGATAQVKNLLKQNHKIKIIFYGGNVKGYLDGEFTVLKKDLSCRIEIYTEEV